MSDCELFAICSVYFSAFSYYLIPAIVGQVCSVFVRESAQSVELKSRLKECSGELAAISAVDEFARHAKKKRELVKLREQLKEANSVKSSSSRRLKAVLYLILVLFTLFLVVYTLYHYHSRPLLSLPSDWVWPVQRLLSWPLSMAGSGGEVCPVSLWFLGCLAAYLQRITAR